MNNKYILGIIAVVVVVIIIIMGVRNSSNESGDVIKIGAIISETGVASAFGEMAHKGLSLAEEEINENGGINGKLVKIIYEDDQTDPKVSSGLFQKVTGIDHVGGIIGSNFDFVTQPLFSLAKTNKVVVISPSNPRIPGAFDTNEYSFVMMTDFDSIIRSFKSYLQTTDYNKLGILRFESSFAEQIQSTLGDIQTELGKPAIVFETYKQIGNNDFKTQILKLKQAQADLVFLDMIGPDPVTFTSQAKALGYTPKIISHIGLQDALSMTDVDPNIFNGVVLINWNASPEVFATKFEAKYGIKPDKSADKAYDAVYVLAQAIAESSNTSDVASKLESELFTTPNGEFSFSPEHSAKSTAVLIQKVVNGKLVTLE